MAKSRDEFVKQYGWEIVADVPRHRFVSHDFPALNRPATEPEIILWNELFWAPELEKLRAFTEPRLSEGWKGDAPNLAARPVRTVLDSFPVEGRPDTRICGWCGKEYLATDGRTPCPFCNPKRPG